MSRLKTGLLVLLAVFLCATPARADDDQNCTDGPTCATSTADQGYAWGQQNNVQKEQDCIGDGNFQTGCRQYVQQKQQNDQMQQQQQQQKADSDRQFQEKQQDDQRRFDAQKAADDQHFREEQERQQQQQQQQSQ